MNTRRADCNCSPPTRKELTRKSCPITPAEIFFFLETFFDKIYVPDILYTTMIAKRTAEGMTYVNL